MKPRIATPINSCTCSWIAPASRWKARASGKCASMAARNEEPGARSPSSLIRNRWRSGIRGHLQQRRRRADAAWSACPNPPGSGGRHRYSRRCLRKAGLPHSLHRSRCGSNHSARPQREALEARHCRSPGTQRDPADVKASWSSAVADLERLPPTKQGRDENQLREAALAEAEVRDVGR